MVIVSSGAAASIARFAFSCWKDSIDGDVHADGDEAFDDYTQEGGHITVDHRLKPHIPPT